MGEKVGNQSENQSRRVPGSHSVLVDKRKRASIAGVVDVGSFHETEVVLKIDSGTMVIEGKDLHIGKLDLNDGKLDIAGQIDSIIYEPQQKPVRRSGWFLRR